MQNHVEEYQDHYPVKNFVKEHWGETGGCCMAFTWNMYSTNQYVWCRYFFTDLWLLVGIFVELIGTELYYVKD